MKSVPSAARPDERAPSQDVSRGTSPAKSNLAYARILTGIQHGRFAPGSRLVLSQLAAIRSSTFAYVPGRARSSVAEHDNLVNLIEQRAPFEIVETAAREHRLNTRRAYLESTGSLEGQPRADDRYRSASQQQHLPVPLPAERTTP